MSVALRDLSRTGNNPLQPKTVGSYAPGVYLDFTGRQYLFFPGWDNMWCDTPASDDAYDTYESFLEVGWDGDTRNVTSANPGPNFPVHQGTDTNGERGWAVRQNQVTGVITFLWSEDGDTWLSEDVGRPSFGFGPGRVKIVLTFDDGESGFRIDAYEQADNAPVVAYDLPVTSDSWESFFSFSEASGATDVFPSPLDIRMSSRTIDGSFEDSIDGDSAICGGNYHRVSVRTEWGYVAYLDADVISLPLEWVEETGLPSVGGVTTAQTGIFEGREGEDWTVHIYDTLSMPVVIVDRPTMVYGNGSYGEAGPDDPVFDFGAYGYFSVAVCFRTTRIGYNNAAWVTHGGSSASVNTDGYGIIQAMVGDADTDPRPITLVADGATSVIAEPSESPSNGEVSTAITTVDISATDTYMYVNGVQGPLQPNGFGDISNPNKPLQVALGRTNQYNSFEFFAAALWHVLLSEAQVELVDAELRDPTDPANSYNPSLWSG